MGVGGLTLRGLGVGAGVGGTDVEVVRGRGGGWGTDVEVAGGVLHHVGGDSLVKLRVDSRVSSLTV